MKIIYLLLLTLIIQSCSSIPFLGNTSKDPILNSFKYQVHPNDNGFVIAYEAEFSKDTKEVFVDASVFKDGTETFSEDCDRFSQRCFIHHYDFTEYNAKESIKVIDGIHTTYSGNINIYFYKYHPEVITRVTITIQQ